MKSAGKARSNGLYRHIRTSKEIIRNLLNYYDNTFQKNSQIFSGLSCFYRRKPETRKAKLRTRRSFAEGNALIADKVPDGGFSAAEAEPGFGLSRPD